MRVHDLKCHPGPFEEVITGRKPYEIRRDDRGYAVGDMLRLREWSPTSERGGRRGGEYTGRETLARVTSKTAGGEWGLPSDLCVLGIALVNEADATEVRRERDMTLRDCFAATAIQGLLANPGGPIQGNGMSGWGLCNCTSEDVAVFAWHIADAMLAAREASATRKQEGRGDA